MKRALSVALVTVLSLLVFLVVVGYAQEGTDQMPSALLEQELSSMEDAFGGLQSFMSELIGEVKGNMGDIDALGAKVEDLKDIITAVSMEIKDAEGKIVGLRDDVDGLSAAQKASRGRTGARPFGRSGTSALLSAVDPRKPPTVGYLRLPTRSLVRCRVPPNNRF